GSIGDAANATTENAAIRAAHSTTFDDTKGNNLSNRLTLRHRFEKRGRNVSADISVGHTVRDGDGSQRSLTDFYQGTSTTSDTLDQQSGSHTVTNSYSTAISNPTPTT